MENEINILKLQYQIYELKESISDLSVALLSIYRILDEDKLNSVFMEIKEETNYEDNINKIEEKKKELAEQIKEYSEMNFDDIFKKMFGGDGK